MAQWYEYQSYLIRRKILKLFGGVFHVYNPHGEVVLYAKMKAFKLKEDIRLYTGEDMQTELLTIKARRVIDFSSEYDVYDATTNEKVGALKRKGLKSMFKDEWLFLDTSDRQIGSIKEDTILLALLRRFLTNLIPQKYVGEINGTTVCKFAQNFNPFVIKINADFFDDKDNLLDRRLGIAAAILLCAIEGKQS